MLSGFGTSIQFGAANNTMKLTPWELSSFPSKDCEEYGSRPRYAAFLFFSRPKHLQESEPIPSGKGKTVCTSYHQECKCECDRGMQRSVLHGERMRVVQRWSGSEREATVWTERLRSSTSPERPGAGEWLRVLGIKGEVQNELNVVDHTPKYMLWIMHYTTLLIRYNF